MVKAVPEPGFRRDFARSCEKSRIKKGFDVLERQKINLLEMPRQQPALMILEEKHV
jgi:hypothetical protein